MGQTLTEKILAKASGLTNVTPGELILVNVDVLMTHDPCTPAVIEIFKKEFGENSKIWDKNKHIMIPEHFVFTADEKANANIRIMREFSVEQEHKYFYDVGTEKYEGVCHTTLAEKGHNLPGTILVGTDSHTVTAGAFGTFAIGIGNTDAAFVLGTGKIFLKVPETIKITLNGILPKSIMAKDLILRIIGDLTVSGATYKAIEFDGETIENMSTEERMTLCNMTIEAGAKNAIIVPNKQIIDYLNKRTKVSYTILYPDEDAGYCKELVYDVTNMQAIVAYPPSPDNVRSIEEAEDDSIELEQVYIGSCTGGKLEDFIAAARILKGHEVKVKTFGVPATKTVIEGLMKNEIDGVSIYNILTEAGVNMSLEPSCAACLGGPIDTFGRVDKAINVLSTTNRNFVGRMGHKEAKIYLASPLVAAASAIKGKIINPSYFLEGDKV
ncbi:MAG TPA: homoaconitate hydratase family protein [Bacteroidia bacterium]|nr:homoaconitate hydratase family protein [Bacteroidia bacterium]